MKKIIIFISLILVLGFSACSNEEEVEVVNDVEQDAEISDAELLTQTFGFYVEIPEGYSLSEPTDAGGFWVGPEESDFWYDGFFILPVDDLDARVAEVQEDVAEVIEVDEEIAVGNVNAYRVIVSWAVGYEVTFYFVESNSGIFEIQALTANEVANGAIMDSLFVPEIVD